MAAANVCVCVLSRRLGTKLCETPPPSVFVVHRSSTIEKQQPEDAPEYASMERRVTF